MTERFRVEFVVEVEPTIDVSAMEAVGAVLLGALADNGMFPDWWAVKRVEESA